jgi:hypothetical protein
VRAGGRFRRGFVFGQTDPDGEEKPTDAVTVQDVHATVLHSLGIDPHKVMASPVGRTGKLSEGSVVPALLAWSAPGHRSSPGLLRFSGVVYR